MPKKIAKSFVTVILILSAACGKEEATAPTDPAAAASTTVQAAGQPDPVNTGVEETVAVPDVPDTEAPATFALVAPATLLPAALPTFSWAAAERARRYNVVIASDAACAVPVQSLPLVTSTSVKLTVALTTGSYYLCVEAENDIGATAASNTAAAFAVDAEAPVGVSSFAVVTMTGLGVMQYQVGSMDAARSDWTAIEVRYQAGSTPPSCSAGTAMSIPLNVPTGYTTSGVFAASTAGATYAFRFCIKDAAGNEYSERTVVATSGQAHRMFATSARFSGNLTLDYANINGGAAFASGTAGGDARCQKLAEGTHTAGVWKAVLADGNDGPKDRLLFSGSIVDMVGNTIAANATALWSGSISNRVKYDESYQQISSNPEVWTGSSSAGASLNACAGFTTAVSNTFGSPGSATATNSGWLTGTGVGCDNQYRLYCVEQVP